MEKEMNPLLRYRETFNDYGEITDNIDLILSDLDDYARHPHYYTPGYIRAVAEHLYEVKKGLEKNILPILKRSPEYSWEDKEEENEE
jgi:hypothetical protein